MASSVGARSRKAGHNASIPSHDDPKLHGKGKSITSSWISRLSWVALIGAVLGGSTWWFIMPRRHHVDLGRSILTPEKLLAHCEHIGPPRIEEVTEGVYLAIGYDLANTILIKTSVGHVIVDVAMNPERALAIRKDLEEAAGVDKIHTVIYTHSHVDHVGGAEVWVENGTEVWGTKELTPHYFKQYGAFRKAESLRGARQFGSSVSLTELPCSGLGAKADVFLTFKTMAFVIPTHTFTGRQTLTVGDVTIELVEAHGETHDQLFVWIPSKSCLLPGDNYYHAFPNLYTVRGSSPRPIREWIRSLDEMRRLAPEYLVPSHTRPLIGKDQIAKQLTDYRDGIQWVYVETIRGANDGRSIDELAEEIALPRHLRDQPALEELYGQIDWSVRAIYGNELGWFDGRAEDLYKLPKAEESGRLIDLLGGASKVFALAEEAASEEIQDYRWAYTLVKLLKEAKVIGAGKTVNAEAARQLEIRCLRGIGESIFNTNGRGYLFEVAEELRTNVELPPPVVGNTFVESIPIDLIFDIMITRIIPEYSIETHMTAIYHIGEIKYYVTVRYGIAEIIKGEPLYGTPEPVGTFKTDEKTFRKIALKMLTPAVAVTSGLATVTGDLISFMQMMKMFEQGP